MKKMYMKAMLLFFAVILAAAFSFSASALTTENCVGEGVDVYSYSQLKEALENFSVNGNIVLQSNITENDDGFDYEIEISKYGAVTLDLNGYNIYINSKKTKTLFSVAGQTRLYFVNGKEKKSAIRFNTVMPDAALVRANHNFAEVTNVNVDFSMGKEAGYKETTNGSDSYIFYAEKASEFNFYSGVLYNGMKNGGGIYISPNENNKQKLNFRLGGYTEIEADKYAVNFDPQAVRYVKFGSVRLKSLNSDKGMYPRIKVSGSSSVTLKDLWYTSEAGSGSAIYVGGKVVLNQNRKVSDLDKADIVVDKTCDTLNNAEYYMLLNCSAGHVRLCGVCYMACDGVEAHNSVREVGVSASCTAEGITFGERCSKCNYTTAKIIRPKGHSMTYVPAVEEDCGIDGVKEHYYCGNCRISFLDAKGLTPVSEDSLITKNNHEIIRIDERFPTCTQEGLSNGVVCLTCGKIVKAQTVTPAKGHTVVPITTYKEATCTKEGRTEGKKCSFCDEVIEESQVIPEKPHSTKIVEGYAASCTQDGLTFGEYCLVCGYVVREQEKIPAKGHIEKIIKGKDATCQEDGLTDGLVCEVCDLVIKGQEKIEKGAHIPETVEGRKATCKDEGLTDGRICSVCKTVLKKQDVIPRSDEHTKLIVKGTAATCEKEGLSDGVKCSVCEIVIEAQQVTAKLPHTHKVVKGEAASCKKEGKTDGIICGVCSVVIEKQEETEKLPHSEKVVKGTEATCEKEGKTDGIVCGVCNEILEKQEVIPRKDHTVVSSVIRADLKNDGEIKEMCAVCKKNLGTKTISRIKSVSLSKTAYVYDGKTKTPSVTVKTEKGEALKKGTDYDLSYSKGRKAIGSYTVKVTFKGNYNGEKTLTFKIRPGKTEKISVKSTENSIKLSWTEVKGATGYRVYLYNEKTKKYKTLGTTEKLSCTVKKLKAGASYKFAVKAYTKTEKGVLWASESTKLTTVTKPIAPTVSAKAGAGKASLSWKKVEGATGYIVYMSDKKDGDYKKLGSTSKLSCTVKNLKKGKTYYFKVKAYTKVDGKTVYGDSCKYKAVKIK